MRVASPLAFRETTDIAGLFGNTASTVQIRPAEPMGPQRPLLLPHLSTVDIQIRHELIEPAHPISISAIPDALVSARSSVGTRELVYLTGPSAVPSYVDNYIRDGLSPRDTLMLPDGEIVLPGISVLVTHWNSTIYGHWLMEGMPKLLLLRQIRSRLPSFRLVTPSACAGFVKAWAALILPDTEIVSFDESREHLRCEHLVLPSWLGGRAHHYHPSLGDMVDRFCTEAGAAQRESMLYVTRLQENPNRIVSNRLEIERIARQFGFQIVAPEGLSVVDQIRLFASASIVVGPFGSSMHNALFSAPDTKVLCLNWVNPIQCRIAHLRRQAVGYMLEPGGRCITYDRKNPKQEEFTIDPGTFATALNELCA